MSEQNPELEPFAKFIVALEPWLGEAVLVGGWAHRLYRLDSRARKLDYMPLTTLDGDVAVPARLKEQESTVRDRLLEAGFHEDFAGEDHPPATHYHYGKTGSFYAEFLAPLVGSEYDRRGKRKATMDVGGVSSQLLRYIEILLVSPWKVELNEESGYPSSAKKAVQLANPASFLAQKILIHDQRDHKDRAKDLLYIHDTVEVFSESLDELRKSLPERHRLANFTRARWWNSNKRPTGCSVKSTTRFARLLLWLQDESSLRRDWLRQRKRG